MGPNGAGKTTFLNILLNIVKKDSGQVRIFGLDHIKHESKIKEKIGVVFEEQNFYKNARIEYLLKFCSAFYPHWNWGKVALLRKKFKLNENLKFMQLSRGMKVKLALIIAISIEAELLIFDEPFAGLDPDIRHAVIDEIRMLKKERSPTIIFSSQNMNDVENLADRIALIRNGSIVFNESFHVIRDHWIHLTVRGNHCLVSKKIVQQKKNSSFIRIVANRDDLKEIAMQNPGFDFKHAQVKKMGLEELFLECVRS